MKSQLSVPFLVLLVSASCLSLRSKRIINGLSLYYRPENYNAVKYSGALATVHTSLNWLPLWAVWRASGILGRIECAGSLISPVIFQTACNCVATFHGRGVIVNNIWEEPRVVYVGVSSRYNDEYKNTIFSMANSKYIKVDKYIVHRKCASLGTFGYTHNYAIAQLDDGWLHTDPFDWLQIKYAPQYTVQDMKDFHVYATSKLQVCMTLGWGYTGQFKWTISEVLRHGWVTLRSDRKCMADTVVPHGISRDLYNWVCYSNFPLHFQGGWVLDYGGPLSCNNRYFGIFSTPVWEPADPRDRFVKRPVLGMQGGMYGAVVHNLFVNAIEYRDSLQKTLFRLGSTYRDDGKQDLVVFRRGSRDGISVKREKEFGTLTSQGSKPLTAWLFGWTFVLFVDIDY